MLTGGLFSYAENTGPESRSHASAIIGSFPYSNQPCRLEEVTATEIGNRRPRLSCDFSLTRLKARRTAGTTEDTENTEMKASD
jgi:hypothetical protein